METNHEVLRHLENCAACSAELDMRTNLRARLKSAVQSESVPADLHVKIRERIRNQGSTTPTTAEWTRWAVAIAAVLLVCVGTWVAYPRRIAPELADRGDQDTFIQKVSQTISGVLKVGLRDHIHCAVFRKYPKSPPPLDQMAESIGPAYKGLIPLVRTSVPDEYRIIMAHQCAYSGRQFAHLTLRNGSKLISLVITRKRPGESLKELSPALQVSGVPVYHSAAQGFDVAGFETEQYFAFVVSDLSSKNNLQVAGNLAPSVHAFLEKAQG